jgi:uncharacterized protein (TIGR00369 family)
MVEISPDAEPLRERLQQMNELAPQARAIGMQLVKVEGPTAFGRVAYRADLVGDPDSGVIAGGVVTTFLDHLCGMAAVLGMREPSLVATIDLRIDYMRAAEPGRDIQAEASCAKITRNVAFVRAVAYEDSTDNPIAHASATFMLDPNRNPAEGAR